MLFSRNSCVGISCKLLRFSSIYGASFSFFCLPFWLPKLNRLIRNLNFSSMSAWLSDDCLGSK